MAIHFSLFISAMHEAEIHGSSGDILGELVEKV